MVKYVVDQYWLKVYNPDRGGPKFSNMLCADDVLLTARVTVCDGMCVKSILDAYCSMSSQQINPSKSFVSFSPSTPQVYYLYSVTDDRKERNLEVFGCADH